MPRIWIDAAAVLLAATLLGGCATSKEKLLPHGDNTMLDIWHRETGGGAGSGQAARQDAGPMVAQVVGALVGASVPGATRPLTLVSPPAATYRAGHQYIPSAFEAETIFRKPQNP